MSEEYPIEGYELYPHTKYRCPECESEALAIGWVVDAMVCENCNQQMGWVGEAHIPEP